MPEADMADMPDMSDMEERMDGESVSHEAGNSLDEESPPSGTSASDVLESPGDYGDADSDGDESLEFDSVEPSFDEPGRELELPRGVPATNSTLQRYASRVVPSPAVGDVQDLIATLPKQKEKLVACEGATFTLMVVGGMGLGKTTFVNTLLDTRFMAPMGEHNPIREVLAERARRLDVEAKVQEARRIARKQADAELKAQSMTAPSPTVADQASAECSTYNSIPLVPFEDETVRGLYDKTTKIEVRQGEIEENGFRTLMTVVDTPGFGDFTNNDNAWVPIVNYIDAQHRLYMLQEEQPDRSRLMDTRVYACLYFIRPSGHGLFPLDIKVMKELSSRVNLIPVIAKADALTRPDLARFKLSIRESIAKHGIRIYMPVDEEPGAYEYPFAVIASEEFVELPSGQHVRGRAYQWGVAEVDNPAHCDFGALQRVLMSERMLDLIDTTVETHYAQYRAALMQFRIRCAKQMQKELAMRPVDENRVLNGTDTADTEESAEIVAVDIDEAGGTETLLEISRFDNNYLRNKAMEQDPVFTEGMKRLEHKMLSAGNFMELKFELWRRDLEEKKAESESEETRLENVIKTLVEQVHVLQREKSKHG